jgi:hypothetical protein
MIEVEKYFVMGSVIFAYYSIEKIDAFENIDSIFFIP